MRWPWMKRKVGPKLSIVVVVYDMNREAPRTLRSLTSGYQRGVSDEDFEVIVMDNGSPEPLDEQAVRDMGPNFRYVYLDNAHPSPVFAINEGVRRSRGEIVGIWIDGARIASPGILQTAIDGLRLRSMAVVATIGYHLGPKAQQESIEEGYDKAVEDSLLQEINFPECDYRLFEISAFAGSSKNGVFIVPAESNAIFLRRDHFDSIGGYDERFDLPGGGLANHDFFERALEVDGAELVIPVGEGTFHQLHGGISTNVSRDANAKKLDDWLKNYRTLKGRDWGSKPVTANTPIFLGTLRREHLKTLRDSVELLESAFRLDAERKSTT